MEPRKLVRVANQIEANQIEANQIEANRNCGPDKRRAIAGVVDHQRRLWSPPMLEKQRAAG